MKKRIVSLLLALALILPLCPAFELPLLSLPVSAATSGTTGDCSWTLDGTVLTISGSGKMGDYEFACGPWGTSVASVIIDNGVTNIGGFAFYDCRNLTSVEIPDSVTSIGDDAFLNCHSLTFIEIPDSVTSFGYESFCSSGLTSVVIPGSVTSIGHSAFFECYNLTSVVISDGVKSIGGSAFHGCSSLTSVTIPDSVTSIGDWVFSYCSSLTAITIPDSVTSIGDRAFEACSSLTSIAVAEGNQVYHSAGNCLIETESKALIAGCPNSIIPSDGSVTSIGQSAFWCCGRLTSVTIPDSVTSIGGYAFYYCSSLTTVTIPDSVTSIGDHVFYGCSSLTTVWYEGSESDRSKISIDDSNDELTSATWHYVDNVCDADCNECGYTRTVPEHVFDDASDVLCNECGYSKVQVATSLSLTVEERIYLNLWLDAADVDAYKALTGKDFTYDATMGERSLGAGSVTGSPVETEYGTYYIIRLDAVSANLFGEQILVDCPTGVINAVGDEALSVLSLAKGGIAQYQDQKVKDLFTALYNYGASVLGEAPLNMPESFVKDQKSNIQVTAKTNETATFQNVYLLMGDSIGIRLKGKLLGDENALSLKVFGGTTEYQNPAYKLNVEEDGTLTIDLYVSADHFYTDLTIKVYSGEDVIASFIGSVKGYSEQIADQDAKTLALAQFVQACVNYKCEDPIIPDHMGTDDVPDVGSIPL